MERTAALARIVRSAGSLTNARVSHNESLPQYGRVARGRRATRKLPGRTGAGPGRDPNRRCRHDVQPLPGQQLQVTMRLRDLHRSRCRSPSTTPARISFDCRTRLGAASRRIDVHSSGLDTIVAAETKDRTRLGNQPRQARAL